MSASIIMFLLFGCLCTLTATKPVQETNEQAVRHLDTLAGLTMGSSKSTRSVGSPIYHSRISMDTPSEDDEELLHYINRMANGGGNYLRALDSLGGGNMLRHPSPMLQQSGYDYRALDSLGGGNLLRREQQQQVIARLGGQGRVGGGNARSDKRLDTLSGITLGHQKRNLDEIDRTAFDDLRKRDFDEVDRTGFDGFS